MNITEKTPTEQLVEHLAKLPAYKIHPHMQVYLKAIEDNDNFEFQKDMVKMETETWPVYKLYWSYNNNRIVSLSPYLQRVLLEKVWMLKDWKKAKSYIRSIWQGTGRITPLTLVPSTLVLSNVREKIGQTKQIEILTQLQELEKAIIHEIKHNGQFINIDGQTRSECAIVPYVNSKFTLSDDSFNNKLQVWDERVGNHIDVSLHLFSELSAFQQGKFFNEQLLINIITQGTLQQVSDALIAINSNEKWKEWQRIFNNANPTSLKYYINDVMMVPEIHDFLTKRMSQKYTYNTQFSGWEWFIAEELVWYRHLKTPNLKLLEEVSQLIHPSPTQSESDFIKEMINIWITEYKSNTAVKPTTLTSYMNFRDVLNNHNNKTDAFYSIFDIPEVNVLSEGKFLDWYIKVVKRFESKVINVNGVEEVNRKHWVKDKQTGRYSSVLNGWPSHCEGGIKFKSRKGRIEWLLGSLKEDFQELLRKNIISTNVVMPDMPTVMVSNNFEDTDGDEMDLTRDETYERGHITSKYNEGDDELSNIKPQKKKSNRSYGRKNIIIKEK